MLLLQNPKMAKNKLDGDLDDYFKVWLAAALSFCLSFPAQLSWQHTRCALGDGTLCQLPLPWGTSVVRTWQ